MKIFIDADGCPVVDIAVRAARRCGIECTIICDTAHSIQREGADTIIVDKGADSVDFKLVNLIHKGDIAVTQDYGLAAMCLSKGAFVLHQDGKQYTEENISGLLEFRAVAKKAGLSRLVPHFSEFAENVHKVPAICRDQKISYSAVMKQTLACSRKN